MKVFPVDPVAMFKISTFFLAPGTKLIYSRKRDWRKHTESGGVTRASVFEVESRHRGSHL